jgi:biopolymer transport protein ExbD
LFHIDALHLTMAVLIILALVGIDYLFVSKRAELADARSRTSEQVAAQVDKANTTFQAQTAAQIATLAAQNVQLQTTVKALADAIATRDHALVVQTGVVEKMTPTDLGRQWGASAAEPAPGVNGSGNFEVSLPLAQKSTVALTTVPVLQKDKADLQASVDKQSQVIANGATALDAEKQAHANDVQECKADKRALSDQITQVKADARKSGFRKFLYGALTGVGIMLRFVH